jgi:anti-sigma-K factor RskA
VTRARSTPFGRGSAAVLAIVASCLLVAAIVHRAPPDLANRPVVAIIRDGQGSALWTLRLGLAAREVLAQSGQVEEAPQGRAYQLWVATPHGTRLHSLGLLPARGERAIPETPTAARLLAGRFRLIVTLEPAQGSPSFFPSGPTEFRLAPTGSG